MLDIKFIRENTDIVQAGAKKKHIDFEVEKLIIVDNKRKTILAEVEEMRAEQNEVSEKIGVIDNEDVRAELISSMGGLKEKLKEKEEDLKKVMIEWRGLMVQVPNIPDVSVPEGESDEQNREERTWGEKPDFDFETKSHFDLMAKLGMADFERGTKVSGFRGYYLKGDGALLNFAIWQFALKHFTGKGFTPLMVPSLVRKETLIGTGYLPQGEEDMYKTQDDEFFAGTGEVATMGYHMDELIDITKLPLKYLAFSPCFRREVGSYGKDTKGLIRVHEFFKWEQVVLCEAKHETTVAHHEELTKNAEEFIQALGLPYRVVVNCGGDLGLGQVKKYDIETWVPSERKYRETHSSSYFHDFQTRRLNIKYIDKDGKKRFAHSLNNTAIATPRVLVSIIENNQQADGTIKVPEVLRKYIGKDVLGDVGV